MKTVWIDVIGSDGIRYGTKQYVRSRRRKTVNIDKYLNRAMYAMMWLTAILTLYGLWQIVRGL